MPIAATELGHRQIEAVMTGRWKVIFPPVGAPRAARVFDLEAVPPLNAATRERLRRLGYVVD